MQRVVGSARALARLRIMVVVVACLTPCDGAAQAPVPYRIELVEQWIKGHADAERVWRGYLSQAGIAFEMTDDVESRLRRAGADDEWIAVLRKAEFIPSQPQPSRASSSVPARRDLRPLYFGREARVIPYVGIAQLLESGGAVEGYAIQTSRGRAWMQSTPVPSVVRTYGFLADYHTVALDFEWAFQQDVSMVNFGLKYSPFLPLGASGIRLLVGIKPMIGGTSQTLARFPQGLTDRSEPRVTLENATAGGEVSGGVAYHWRPGHWLFAEVGYRSMWTYSRHLSLPDQRERVVEGISWSNWAAQGVIFRMGVGF